MEEDREELVMEETEERKGRDVRAIRWLVDNTTVNVETEPFVLAIPGSFDTKWGLDVWRRSPAAAWNHFLLSGLTPPFPRRNRSLHHLSMRTLPFRDLQ
jgi:hypothetical protein